MNERKLLTLRFLFRAIRFRPGCRRNGRMRWPRRNHYPAYLAIGSAYARISRQRSSGGFRWIRRDVNLSGRHALLFPDCSDMRTPKPFARFSSSHRKILFFHSFFFSPFSSFTRSSRNGYQYRVVYSFRFRRLEVSPPSPSLIRRIPVPAPRLISRIRNRAFVLV